MIKDEKMRFSSIVSSILGNAFYSFTDTWSLVLLQAEQVFAMCENTHVYFTPLCARSPPLLFSSVHVSIIRKTCSAWCGIYICNV